MTRILGSTARWDHWSPSRVVAAGLLVAGSLVYAAFVAWYAGFIGWGSSGLAGAERTNVDIVEAALWWLTAAVCPASAFAIVGALRRDRRWLVPSVLLALAGLLAAVLQLGVDQGLARDTGSSTVDEVVDRLTYRYELFVLPLALAATAVLLWVRAGNDAPEERARPS